MKVMSIIRCQLQNTIKAIVVPSNQYKIPSCPRTLHLLVETYIMKRHFTPKLKFHLQYQSLRQVRNASHVIY